MAIDIAYERQEDILIGMPSGRIDTVNSQELQHTLDSEITDDDQAFIMDFGQVSYISSSGLRVILRIAKRFNEPGKKFAICSLSDSVRDIITVSGFGEIISIYESQAAAISGVKNR